VTWNGRAIKTHFDYPPIPNRNFDWSAWIEGTEDEGMTTGRAATRGQAIADLLEQLL
jgi:hypothetical protein